MLAGLLLAWLHEKWSHVCHEPHQRPWRLPVDRPTKGPDSPVYQLGLHAQIFDGTMSQYVSQKRYAAGWAGKASKGEKIKRGGIGGRVITHVGLGASVVMMGFRPSFLRFLFTVDVVADVEEVVEVESGPFPLAPAIMGGTASD